MVKGFCDTWLRACNCEVVDVLRDCISVRVWCLVHVRVIILVHYYTYLDGTWLERYRCTWLRDLYEDVCIGNNYSLDIVACCRLMWQRKKRVKNFQERENHSFQKDYTGCNIDRSHTYAGCSIHRSHTYTRCNIEMSFTYGFLLVQEGYRYRFITSLWYGLVIGCWHILVQDYSGISHSESVAVVSSFHLYFRVTGWGKDRLLYPSSGLFIEHRGL